MKKRLLATLAGAVMVLPFAAWADAISPESFSASGPVGFSATVHKTVTVAAGAPTTTQADVFFLADTTGSMGGTISSVRTNASNILSTLAGGGDFNFGVGAYKDNGDVYVYQLTQAMTASQAAAQTGINTWVASGGGDYYEAELYALYRMATDAATGWRAGSARFAVWFGGAPGHDPSGPTGVTEAQATAALVAAGIRVFAIDVGSMNGIGQAARIAAATGGAYLTGTPSGVPGIILSALGTAFANYKTVGIDTSEVPAGVGVSVAPGSYSGTFDRSIDRTFEFDVTFTGTAPGDYVFSTYATVDGGRVATERDHITVAGEGAVPEPGTMILLGSGLLGLSGLARRKRAS